MSQDQIALLVSELTNCVANFHKRFGYEGSASRQDLLTRIPIQDEEVRELRDAILGESPARVASEAADVLFVAIGTMLRLDPELSISAIHEVITKNDAKTWETHYIDDAGKISRR